jgi:hypothetical protein
MAKLTRIKLLRVEYIPKELQPGILYVAEEFDAAVHLCACGCGSKVSTPLGPTEWSFQETAGEPSLRPSIGNWQRPCQSHYFITRGNVIWCAQWSTEQIAAGRQAEEARRRVYYEALESKRGGILRRIWRWIKKLLRS